MVTLVVLSFLHGLLPVAVMDHVLFADVYDQCVVMVVGILEVEVLVKVGGAHSKVGLEVGEEVVSMLLLLLLLSLLSPQMMLPPLLLLLLLLLLQLLALVL